MPPNDQAPRYQLVDPSTGNVVGSVFGDGNGNVVIADETDTQTTFDANGITTPALEATASLTDPSGTEHTVELAEVPHGNDDENYTLQIDGTQVQDGDTINFQTN